MRALTAAQEQAVARRREPLALAAGAGSGKTSVLVERFVRAVCEDGHAPERILAITFTERAGGELKARIRERLLAAGAREAASATEHAYVGTFHGFCARLLRAHPRAAGLEAAQFAILDEALAGRLRRRAFAAALGEFLGGERAQAVDLIAAYGADRARATVLGVFAELRSRGQYAPRLPRAPLTQLKLDDAPDAPELRAADALALWDELLRRFGARYEASKRVRDGLDFDDLELRAGELLAGDAQVRRAWAERFELLMVDELQDVNPRQLALLQALERENLFTVGDEWQSIYGFRHADVNLFRVRAAELAGSGRSLRLQHNFRGRAELLEAVNAVFAPRFGKAFTPLRAGRERARAGETEGAPLLELLLADRRGPDQADRGGAGARAGEGGAPAWREAEARQLAGRVAELVQSGLADPGEVAVLLRATGDIDCYERALRARGLQTAASAGAFWERQEVADLLAYLRTLADPLDELALYGALRSPLARVSRDVLAGLALAAQRDARGAWQTLRELDCPARDAADAAGNERLADFCRWLDAERLLAPQLQIAQLLERVTEHWHYASSLRSLPDGERRLANVGRLIELAESWERSEGRDLRGFLEEAAFQQDAGRGRVAGAEAIAEPDALAPGQARDAVRLMSVHAAKGLEFDVVCIADLGRSPGMGLPDLLVDGERVGLRLLDLRDAQARATLGYERLAQERREAQAAEEERIMYVAMTRARERLLLSGAVDFAAWPRDRPGAAPIVWLGRALSAELPVLCREATRGSGQTRSLAVDGTDVALACRLSTATPAPTG